MNARTLSCFDEIMRLLPDGSSVHDDDCMDVSDDDGMEVCDKDCKNDSDNLRDGPNYEIKQLDKFDESNEKTGASSHVIST